MAPPLHVVALVMALVCVSGSVAVTALRAPRWSPWARPSSAHVALAATTSEKPETQALTDSSAGPPPPAPTEPAATPPPPSPELWFGLPRKAVAEPFLVFLVGQALIFLGVGAIGPGLTLFGQSLGLDARATGAVISAPALAMLVLTPIAGRTADRVGRKPLILGGLSLVALGDLATGSCAGLSFPEPHRMLLGAPLGLILALLSGRLVLGAGRGVAESAERAFVADLCARVPDLRGRVLAVQQAVTVLGLAVGPVLGGIATERLGPGAPFFGVATAAALAAVLYGLLLPETGGGTGRAPPPGESGAKVAVALTPVAASAATTLDAETPEAEGLEEESLWWQLLRSPSQRVLLTLSASNALGLVTKITVVPMLLASPQFASSARDIGALFSGVAFIGLGSATVGGWVADRGLGPKPVVVAGSVLCGAGWLLAALAPTKDVLLGAFLMWGAGVGALGPALQACAQRLAPEGEEGTALTLPKAVNDLVFVVGPFTLGAISDAFDPSVALVLAASVNVAAAALFWAVF